ncbi:BNR repeat-containing protein [Mucilaginibacter sp. RS28]|uniref:BNR repeat-containing protein n=1 Tax=Mucilaginibacter straminoryzae TaxID=2932774 RepID=A0A9X1X0S2_9SPHI|nr:BNR repeat-containing protein [Mucilaginibacter straminoryzae]MCJ8209127.1 BNR repeat-containing protein [Mucilaginibacter straminoryzae]
MLVALLWPAGLFAQSSVIASDGWANNSVNTVVFRKNSLVTFKNIQYAAYYDAEQYVVLASRTLGTTTWQTHRTAFKGDATDAHKSISIIADGDGYLHVSWGHHNQPLNYCRSVRPGSLQLTDKLSMTSDRENKITYPEFYKLPSGDLLFFYRDGASGNGNLVLNRYDVKTKTWRHVQHNLIDGEGKRNAYWQITIDVKGTLHLSWVWRESPDVASNHDMCYAKSDDGGITWKKSTGEIYMLPITQSTAEYACHIPQNSELINQTAMFADENGHPYIATYWRGTGDAVPQYHLIYNTNGQWQSASLGFRKTGFSLSGAGTKSIPISRPQILAWKQGKKQAAALVFRDLERGSKVSIAVNRDLEQGSWKVTDLSAETVGSWEPTYDTELWKAQHKLDLFVEKTVQMDAEGKADIAPQQVQVIEWKP